ncbi:kinase binding protein CGI-121-domain-containing protein, partial [Gautieria morchelliformis]
METHTVTYPHFPSEVSTVHLALYSNVTNAARLKERLVRAATLPGEEGGREREVVNYAFIDAKLITSRLHVQTAVYQAILAYTQRSLRTKTVHSEVLWALSPGHNISEAIKRFGISDTSQALLVVRVCAPSLTLDDFESKIGLVLKGDLLPLSSLEQITDWTLVRKYYKLSPDPSVQASLQSQPEHRAYMDQLVISCVAMKSVSA